MRTATLLACAVGATAVAVVALRGPAAPSYDGPVALAAPDASATSTAESPPDWTAVIAELDAARAEGFADPATADPRRWADAACPCLDEDRRRLAALASTGRSVDAAPASPVDVVARPRPGSADQVTVTFTDRLMAYAELDAAGRVVRAWAGRGAQRWRGELVRTGGGWRWREVTRVTDDHDPAHGVDPDDPG